MVSKQPRSQESSAERDERADLEVFEVSGSIKWFDPSKGYGFIIPDENLPDIFLHLTCLRRCGFQTAFEGYYDAARCSGGLAELRSVCLRWGTTARDNSAAFLLAQFGCRFPETRGHFITGWASARQQGCFAISSTLSPIDAGE